MGVRLNKISDNRAEDLRKAIEYSSELLEDGPVILGEKHDEKDARLLASEMIRRDRVRKLYIEFPDPALVSETIDRVVRPTGHKSLSRYLNANKREKFDVNDHALTEFFREYPLMGSYYRSLLTQALKSNVDIFFYDRGRFDPRMMARESLARESRLRDETSGEFYRDTTGNDQTGVLVIAGAAHLYRDGENGKSLQDHMGIEDRRSLDLSIVESPYSNLNNLYPRIEPFLVDAGISRDPGKFRYNNDHTYKIFSRGSLDSNKKPVRLIYNDNDRCSFT